VYIAQPFREDGLLLLNLDAPIQDDFVVVLHDKLALVLSILESDSLGVMDPSIVSQQVVLLVRLLQFNLGFRGAWTPKLKDLSIGFINVLFRIALVGVSLIGLTPILIWSIQRYGTPDHLDLIVYPLIIDTLLYLIDGKTPSPLRISH
jgi:mediator of RNA polymerase II transcription subunit 12